MHKEILVDTAKASLPIVAGVVVSFLKASDEYVTLLTHWCGLVAAICGSIWYLFRIWDDIKKRFGGKKQD